MKSLTAFLLGVATISIVVASTGASATRPDAASATNGAVRHIYVTNVFSKEWAVKNVVRNAKEFDYISDLVVALESSGETCKVRGHRWGSNPSGIVFAVIRPEGYRERTCPICNKTETSTSTEWK